MTDDVATLLFAATGLDRTQGTEHDYDLIIEFVGESNDCDIPVKMGYSSFASCAISGTTVASNSNHVALVNPEIRLGSQFIYNWYFDPDSNEGDFPDPDPDPDPEDPCEDFDEDVIFQDGFEECED